MIIVAKFASVCPCCSARIAVGSKVEWSRGDKAKHVACAQGSAAGVVVTVSRPAVRRTSSTSRGKWTGCSCGSREMPDGSISDNACWTCRHDAF